MKLPNFSRRNFVKAGAATLSIPFLESIPSQALAATAAPKRVIYIVHHQGCYDDIFFPKVSSYMTSPEGVKYAPLAQMTGDMSQIFTNAKFGKLKSKMNIMRGLDCLTRGGNPFTFGHNQIVPLTAGGGSEFNPFWQPFVKDSIDTVISESSQFYSTTPFRKILRTIPIATEGGIQYHWSYKGGNQVSQLEGAKSVFTDFFSGTLPTAGSTTTTTPVDTNFNRRTALNSLMTSLSQLSASPKLSTADQIKLKNHGDMMTSVINSLAATGSSGSTTISKTCSKPADPGSISTSKHLTSGCQSRIRASLDLIYMALNCQLTNAVVFHPYNSSEAGSDTFGGAGPVDYHQIIGHDRYVSTYLTHKGFIYDQILYLVNLMDSTVESNGLTMLDNSLVVVQTEFGFGSTHSVMDMPVVTFGSLGGSMKTGNYINYQRTGTATFSSRPDHGEAYTYTASLGRPLNNFHVSVLNALGISHSGFGDYPADARYSDFLTDAAKKASLPLLV